MKISDRQRRKCAVKERWAGHVPSPFQCLQDLIRILPVPILCVALTMNEGA